MRDLVGGKALGLARMMAAGERVPPGFCVTTRAHRSGRVPREEVLAAYRELGEGPVAVRSSATAEDRPEASFAGLQDTFLDVEGEEALLEAIERCWTSLHSDRATAYRADLDWEGETQMAVVVQRVIAPRAAGVMFTANPVTGTRGEIVIDATAGLGGRHRRRLRRGRPLRADRRGATERLRTRQIVTIDGSTGTVELDQE